MPADLRVPIGLCFDAFAVEATVTRPAPDDVPIATSVTWIQPLTEDFPPAAEFSRREWRRLLAVRLDQVPTVPRGTLILAPEITGAVVKRWRVDGPDKIEADHVRVVVIEEPDP